MTSAAQPNKLIVIVEDDVDVRETLAEVLEEEGFQSKAFSDGPQALAWLSACQTPPALILLDLMMPTMDGWAFRAEQCRTGDLQQIPTVILSADSNIAENSEALQVAGFLRKPIHMQTLLNLAERFCGPPQLKPGG